MDEKQANIIIEQHLRGLEYAVLRHGEGSMVLFLYPYAPVEYSLGAVWLDSYYLAANQAYHLTRRVIEALREERVAAARANDVLLKPLMSRAGLAGDGFRNTLTYHHKLGSRFHIGCFVVSQALPPTLPSTKALPQCTHCNKCAAACPVGAIGKDGYDRAKCLRQRMTQPDVTEDAAFSHAVGTRMWGCDACQQACPLNAAQSTIPQPPAVAAAIEAFLSGDGAPLSDLIGKNYVNNRLLRLAQNAKRNSLQ